MLWGRLTRVAAAWAILCAPSPGQVIQTVAGTDWVFPGDGKPAISAPLGPVDKVAVDAAGNVYVADPGNHMVMKVDTAGTLTIFAGNGIPGYSGDNGPANRASLNYPLSLAFDPAGNLNIVEGGNLRRVSPTGIISTASRQVGGGDGLVVDPRGNVYFSESGRNTIRKMTAEGTFTLVAGTGIASYSGDNGPATQATLNDPRGLALDAAGNLYVVDLGNNRIRKITPAGTISTFAGNGTKGNSGEAGQATNAALDLNIPLAFGPGGDLFLLSAGFLRKVTPQGIITTVASGAGGRGMTVDAAGVIYVADSGNNRVRRITTSGVVTTLAGVAIGPGSYRRSPERAPATSAWLDNVQTIAVDRMGALFIGEWGSQRVRKVGLDGSLVTIAGISDQAGGPATRLDPPVGLAFDSGNTLHIAIGTRVVKLAAAGTLVEVATGIIRPAGIAFDAFDNLYISDRDGNRIWKQSLGGTPVVFGGTGQPGFSGDNGPATAAAINSPQGVAVDPAGNLLFVDEQNGRLRRITPQGTISTVAQGASFAVAVDRGGTVFFTTGNSVDRIAPNGTRTRFAGDGSYGFSGDGGAPTAAAFRRAFGIAVDAAGSVYIVDHENERVRAVLAPAPTFQLSPANVTLSARVGGVPSPPSSVSVSGSASGLAFVAATASSGGWLQTNLSAGTMPASLSLTADPTGLAAGTYQGTVTITAPSTRPAVQVVLVTLVVQPALVTRLTVEPAALTFGFVRADPPDSRRLSILSPGAPIPFTAVTSERWLSVAPASGSASASVAGNVSVTADPAGMSEGTFAGKVTVTNTRTDERVETPVIATITSTAQTILLSQTGMTFNAVAGGGADPAQNFGVLNSGRGRMSWTATASTFSGGSSWLVVAPRSGTTDASSLTIPTVDVSVNAAGLAAGQYSGQVEIAAPGAANSPQFVSVVLNVLPAGSTPGPVVRPTGLIFTAPAGSSPGSQTATVTNLSATPATFASNGLAFGGPTWFVHIPTNAVVTAAQPVKLVVQPEVTGLTPGIRRGVLTLLFQDGTVRTINLLLVLAGAGANSARYADGCTPTRLLPVFTTLAAEFSLPAGWPATIEAQVVDDCGDAMVTGSVVASFSNGDPPVLLVSLRNGRWSGTWLARNARSPQVTVTLTAESTLPRIQGTVQAAGSLQSNTALPVIGSGAVVSAASYAAQAPVAPGSLVSIFGTRLADAERIATELPLETQLGGVVVALGGRALPLLYASDGQVNAVIPYDMSVNTRHQLLLRRGSLLSVPEAVTVAAAQPAVFTKDRSGRGQGVIVDLNGRYVEPGNAARAGDAVVIFCSGLGAVDPPVDAGRAAPSVPLSRLTNPAIVSIGGRSARVLFAGLAPGFTGLYQLNVVVPEGVSAGEAVPVTVAVADQISPAVTVAIR